MAVDRAPPPARRQPPPEQKAVAGFEKIAKTCDATAGPYAQIDCYQKALPHIPAPNDKTLRLIKETPVTSWPRGLPNTAQGYIHRYFQMAYQYRPTGSLGPDAVAEYNAAGEQRSQNFLRQNPALLKAAVSIERDFRLASETVYSADFIRLLASHADDTAKGPVDVAATMKDYLTLRFMGLGFTTEAAQIFATVYAGNPGLTRVLLTHLKKFPHHERVDFWQGHAILDETYASKNPNSYIDEGWYFTRLAQDYFVAKFKTEGVPEKDAKDMAVLLANNHNLRGVIYAENNYGRITPEFVKNTIKFFDPKASDVKQAYRVAVAKAVKIQQQLLAKETERAKTEDTLFGVFSGQRINNQKINPDDARGVASLLSHNPPILEALVARAGSYQNLDYRLCRETFLQYPMDAANPSEAAKQALAVAEAKFEDDPEPLLAAATQAETAPVASQPATIEALVATTRDLDKAQFTELQNTAVQLLAYHAMSRNKKLTYEQAYARAYKKLGHTGADGVYGRKSKIVLEEVLGLAKEQGWLEVASHANSSDVLRRLQMQASVQQLEFQPTTTVNI